MVSDLHHLRATWSDANNARSNYAFKEIDEADATMYYGNDFTKTATRPKDIENYSTLMKSTVFEPRDAQKGDTARAVAYFYTRYPTEAGAITKTMASVDEMIDWDEQFTPTELQIQQYQKVVEVQGNINPFYEELHLVARAYCDMATKYDCKDFQ
jgi:endonuclease I